MVTKNILPLKCLKNVKQVKICLRINTWLSSLDLSPATSLRVQGYRSTNSLVAVSAKIISKIMQTVSRRSGDLLYNF